MVTLGILCIALGLAFLAMAVAGMVLALTSRGKSRVRKGPEIYAEMQAERMARESRGRAGVAQAGVGYGTGIAWDRTAVYTLPEVKRALRDRQYGLVMPVLLGMGGLLGAIACAGGALALLAPGNARYVGLFLLAIALYGSWIIAGDYRRTRV